MEKRCLWHAKDGRCSSCKARRIKLDVLKQDDYEMCHPDTEYGTCEFFKQKPDVGAK
jgi:hypothetical protein